MNENIKEVITELYDFHNVEIPDVLFDVTFDKSIVRKRLSELGERFCTIIPVEGKIQSGDYVLLDVDGIEGQAAVGTGLFDEEIESMLPERLTGDEFTCGERSVKILSVKRRIVTDPTDEQIKSLGQPGIETYAAMAAKIDQEVEYEAKCESVMIISDMILRKVIGNSTFKTFDRTDPVYDTFYRWNVPDEETESMLNEKQRNAVVKETLSYTRQTYLGMYYAHREGIEYTLEDAVNDYREMAAEHNMEYEQFMNEMMGGTDLGIEEVYLCYIRYLRNMITDSFEDRLRVNVING